MVLEGHPAYDVLDPEDAALSASAPTLAGLGASSSAQSRAGSRARAPPLSDARGYAWSSA